MNTSLLPHTISVPDAGRILGLSRNGAYIAASRGDIPVVRIGRKLRVPTHRLVQLLDSPAASGAADKTLAGSPAGEAVGSTDPYSLAGAGRGTSHPHGQPASPGVTCRTKR